MVLKIKYSSGMSFFKIKSRKNMRSPRKLVEITKNTVFPIMLLLLQD